MTDQRLVTFDLMSEDPDYYFVLTEALKDFASASAPRPSTNAIRRHPHPAGRDGRGRAPAHRVGAGRIDRDGGQR